MEFRILGALEVVVEGKPLPPGSRQQQAILAQLLIEAGRVVPAEQLIDELWADSAPRAARNTLHTYVARLRKLLGRERLETRPPGYLLRVAAGELDARNFERLVADGRRALAGGNLAAAETFEDALRLWRGPCLVNLSGYRFADAARVRYEELRLEALELRADAALAQGRHAELISDLERVLGEHPLRERAWSQLMLALYRSGRQADALAAYHRARRVLTDELGLEPGPELRDLEQRILHQEPTLAPPAVGPAAPATSRPQLTPMARHNLPAQLTRFIGRTAELGRLSELLAEARLVTLTGAGGSGKTRLAVEVARRLLSRFPDGVRFVALGPVGEGRLVPAAVAHAIDVREHPGRDVSEAIRDALSERELLLLLDNCEHVAADAAQLAHKLLTAAPRLRVLATSRAALGLSGETLFHVPLMRVPSEAPLALESLVEIESVQLFLQQAQAVAPGFRPRDENALDLAALCRQLDGLPLALELAATRVRFLDIGQIREQLAHGLDALGDARRGGPARQRTLRATIEWSHRLLPPDERQLLARLDVFAGPFSLDAAVAVGGDDGVSNERVIERLFHLLDRNLVARTEASGGATAYRLLETIRQFALEQLSAGGQEPEVRQRHAAHYARFAEQAETQLTGPSQTAWMVQLQAADGNLLAALGWSVSQRPELALRLASALLLYWVSRGRATEGLDWLRRGLARADEVHARLRGRALRVAARLAFSTGDHATAERLIEEAAATIGVAGEEASEAGEAASEEEARADVLHLRGMLAQYRSDFRRATTLFRRTLGMYRRLRLSWQYATVLHHLGMVSALQGDYERAWAEQQEALDVFRGLGDRARLSSTFRALAVVALDRGDLENATALCREGLQAATEVGDVEDIAHARYTLGDLARLRGDLSTAAALYEQSLGELREIGDRRCSASTTRNLGLVRLAAGDAGDAELHLKESLALRERLGDRAGVAESYEGLAAVASAQAEWGRAAWLYASADGLRRAIGSVRTPAEQEEFSRAIDRLRVQLGDAFEGAWSAGSVIQAETQ